MPDGMSFFADILSFGLDFLEFLTIMVSLITFLVLMLNQFSKALNVILKPCGITLSSRIRALFLCRKSPDKKRAFLEFAILKSKGRYCRSQDWKLIVNEFKNFYSDGERNPVYEIPNCTVLLGEELQEAARRYFEFFRDRKVRRTFGIKETLHHDDPMQWVVRIRVNESYLTPTCLLTGLLSDKEDNWSDFVKRYVSTGYIADSAETTTDDILPEELYLTFAWLLWGPSLELNYKHFWAGLCQLSFGDESNSIPAIADTEALVGGDVTMARHILNQLSIDEDRCYGVLMNTLLKVYENKAYYRKISDLVKPEEAYFYEKIEDGDNPMAFGIEEASRHTGYRSEKYYCTAYVWILFELENEKDDAFHPERTLAFFEHANLADRTTYEFLVATLLDKSIKHFRGVFAREEYKGRKYRFVCAMNRHITEAFQARYEEMRQTDPDFRERILLTPKRIPADVFAEYDNFFSKDTDLTFEEVTLKDKTSIRDLGNFYTEVYLEAFPDENERETFDNLLYYLKQADKAKEYRYHIVLAKDENDNIVAGSVFDYFAKSNSGVIEFIAVSPEIQSSGVGTALFKQVRRIVSEDAEKLVKKQPDYLFCEADSPGKSRNSVNKHLYFWRKHKYKKIDFSYIQPALGDGKEAVNELWLTVACLKDFGSRTIPAKAVLDFLSEYMKHAMKIADPAKTAEYQAMKKELEKKGEVSLTEIAVR